MNRTFTIIEVQEVRHTVVWRHKVEAPDDQEALAAVRSREVASQPQLIETLGDEEFGKSVQEVVNTDEFHAERAALHRAIARFVAPEEEQAAPLDPPG